MIYLPKRTNCSISHIRILIICRKIYFHDQKRKRRNGNQRRGKGLHVRKGVRYTMYQAIFAEMGPENG